MVKSERFQWEACPVVRKMKFVWKDRGEWEDFIFSGQKIDLMFEETKHSKVSSCSEKGKLKLRKYIPIFFIWF